MKRKEEKEERDGGGRGEGGDGGDSGGGGGALGRLGRAAVQSTFQPQFPTVARRGVDVGGCARATVFHACPWPPPVSHS